MSIDAGTDIDIDIDIDIDAELNDVAGHLNAQHGRLVDLTIALLADRSLWQGPGVWTIEQYLAWRVGVSPNRARQIADIARRTDELPHCVDALRRGELSIDQVAPIAKRAPWWTDQQISELAKNLTVTQLRRVVSQYPFPDIAHPDTDTAQPAVGDDDTGSDDASTDDISTDRTSGDASANDTVASANEPGAPADVCRFHTGDDDRFRLYLETDALTGALLETALTEARDHLFQHGHTSVGWVDALREISNRSLDDVDTPSRRDRHRIHLHLDTSGTATDHLGWTVPDAIRRHLCCDGLLTPTFTEGGIPISVGRTQRVVPERTRRLVIRRDHGCRVPGCTNHRFLEVHHIIHWLDHGPTDTWNLIALCPHHHRLHHNRGLGITGNADDPDGVSFTSANDGPITRSGARPEPPGAPPPPPQGVYQHPLGERLESRWLHFAPPRNPPANPN